MAPQIIYVEVPVGILGEVVLFPDVEATLVAYLNQSLAARGESARASTHVPNPRPAQLVRVTRIGGPRRNAVQDDAMVTVQCWAASEVEAADLGRISRGIVHSMDVWDGEIGVFYAGEVGGLAYLPDPDSGTPRYQFTVTLRAKAQVV